MAAVLPSTPHPALWLFYTTLPAIFPDTGIPLLLSMAEFNFMPLYNEGMLHNWLCDHPNELAWWGFREGIHSWNFSLSICCIMWFAVFLYQSMYVM